MPENLCDGSKNNGVYYAGYVTNATQFGTLCKFHIKYACMKDSKLKLIEVDETQKDKLDLCGSKIDSRKSINPPTMNNPNRKSNCELKVIEPKNLDDEAFLKSLWIW